MDDRRDHSRGLLDGSRARRHLGWRRRGRWFAREVRLGHVGEKPGQPDRAEGADNGHSANDQDRAVACGSAELCSHQSSGGRVGCGLGEPCTGFGVGVD